MKQAVQLVNIPRNAVRVTMRVRVKPPTGAILIWTPTAGDDPIRFDGPFSVGDIPISGPEIFIELIGGAKDVNIETIGYEF